MVTEPDDTRYAIDFKNESSSDLIVLSFFQEGADAPRDSVLIPSGGTRTICEYLASSWSSYGCDANKIIEFKFKNGKGYRCIVGSRYTNISDFCFQSEIDPFNPPRPTQGETISIFIVTEEDFVNAFDL